MLKNARACNNSKSFQKSLQNSEKNAKLYNSCKKNILRYVNVYTKYALICNSL